jgi:nitric oxide reductase subunit B
MSWRWKLSVLFVLIAGFSTLIFMGHETTDQAPPVPERVVDSAGKVLFLGSDIMAGQAVFQKYGLMDVGSFFGHGAYNGPDFSADYLHREAVIALDQLAQQKFGKPYTQLDAGSQGDVSGQIKEEFKKNRYDPKTQVLTFTDHQATAYQQLTPHYDTEFGAGGNLPLQWITSKIQQRDFSSAAFSPGGRGYVLPIAPAKTTPSLITGRPKNSLATLPTGRFSFGAR